MASTPLPNRRSSSSTRRAGDAAPYALRKTRLSIALLAWLALGPRLALLRLHDRSPRICRARGRAAGQQSNGVIYADDGKTVLACCARISTASRALERDRARDAQTRSSRSRTGASTSTARSIRSAWPCGDRNIWTGTLAKAARRSPAARQEPWIPRGRQRSSAQDHRGRARLSGRAATVEAEDPRGVPQHDLLRALGLRRRGGRGGHFGVQPRISSRSRRRCWPRSCRTDRTTRHAYRARARAPPPRARQLLEQKYIDASPTSSPTPSRPAGGPCDRFPPEKKTIANYFVDYVRQQLIKPLRPQEGARGGPARVYDAQPAHAAPGARGRAHDAARRRPEAALVRHQYRHRRGQGDDRRARLHEHRLRQVQPRHRRRAPAGSAFKIFVLVAALEEGVLPQTQFDSHRLTLELPGRAVCRSTTTTASTAATFRSRRRRRFSTTRLAQPPCSWHRADPPVAHLMGIARPVGADPAIALGSAHCCTPVEMALAYSTLANQGVRVDRLAAGTQPARARFPTRRSRDRRSAASRTRPATSYDRNKPQRQRVISQQSALTAIAMLRSVSASARPS